MSSNRRSKFDLEISHFLFKIQASNFFRLFEIETFGLINGFILKIANIMYKSNKLHINDDKL